LGPAGPSRHCGVCVAPHCTQVRPSASAAAAAGDGAARFLADLPPLVLAGCGEATAAPGVSAAPGVAASGGADAAGSATESGAGG